MKNLNWIGKIIQWIIEGVGVVGVGVILFTVILKTVVLPLDVYSRVKTKKQSLMMEKLRPQMEKLQKQYKDDKAMYSQKVMELQKQNGYSMFGACLPMIVSLVIFIVVLNAFSTYSQYANLSTYNDMVGAYNQSVQTYVLTDADGKTVNSDGFLIAGTDPATGEDSYLVDFDAFAVKYVAAGNTLDESFSSLKEAEKMVVVRDFVREAAREAAANVYYAQKNGDGDYNMAKFMWVKNIWYPDSMFNKEVPNFTKFSSAISRAVGSGISSSYELSYNEVTYNLSSEKGTYNGYFVLIVLAIILMFLQQFITMRSQKASAELSSVDGSGARTNKWMMILMPVIYGVVSFLYSASFSLYMITNTTYSLITTLTINKVLDVRFAKNGGEFKQRRAKKGNKANNGNKRLK